MNNIVRRENKMSKRCVICNQKIENNYGKINGSIIKAVNENKKNYFIYVCSDCQKTENWIEKAKIRAA